MKVLLQHISVIINNLREFPEIIKIKKLCNKLKFLDYIYSLKKWEIFL